MLALIIIILIISTVILSSAYFILFRDDISLLPGPYNKKKKVTIKNFILKNFGSIKNLYNNKPSTESKQSKQRNQIIQENNLRTSLTNKNTDNDSKSNNTYSENSSRDTSANISMGENLKISTPIKNSDKIDRTIVEMVNEPNQTPSRKKTDNDAVYELLAKAKKSDAELKAKEEEKKASELSKRLLEDLSFTENKPEPKSEELIENLEKSGSSFSLNFIQEQNKLAQSNQSLNSTQSSQSNTVKNQELTNDPKFSHGSTPSIESTQSKSRNSQQSEETQLYDWIQQDAHVIVSTSTVTNKRGHIRYIGRTKFARGTWIGVELEEQAGINDGSVEGVRYFTCPEKKGVFVRQEKLTLVVNKEL
ncbi:unnamed protein product [Brachionus calyciflorus]|uniref:CAP-Gly domain-containing protein n=1 Tax=Brachionus calyciflorus TaxID=104777 RepID=A0A813M2I1_9BILA|nr:unnamed protein product [Brachionus calyciflorus]